MSLPYDPEEAVETIRSADPVMARVIERAGPFELELRSAQPPFQALVRSIIYQQLSGKAAETILGRVLDLFPDTTYPKPEEFLDLPDEALRGAGVSRAKTAAIKDLAAKALDGTVPPSHEALTTMDNAEIIERLTQVYGVGQWTVEMLLIFYLGRPDVLPVTDLGVRKGFMQAFGLDELPTPKELTAHGERWRPYRSVASWYLWRLLDGPY
jgi:DNA-3-methyladenine glycosylase II